MLNTIIPMRLDFTLKQDLAEDELYNALCGATTVEAFIDILRNTKYDFHKMVRPYCNFFCEDALIHDYELEIYHTWTYEEALEVAQIFKDKLGIVAISRMDTYYAGQLVTVMDALDAGYGEHEAVHLFREAFNQLGFKKAKECNPKSLYRLHVDSSARYEILEANRSRFEIDIRLGAEPRRKQVNEEIVMEVFKPERILNWIENGYEVEDYMN